LGAIELLEETGFRLGMPWQHMIVEVSHAQRPPRQRLSSNGHVFCIFQMQHGYEIAGRWPTFME